MIAGKKKLFVLNIANDNLKARTYCQCSDFEITGAKYGDH